MKERERILNLYEIYKDLLTDREKEYFESYFVDDLNLQEIADNYEVSKSYVGKFINGIEDKILNYEYILKIYEKTNKIRDIVKGSEYESVIETIL